jgi:hypothetical protein
MSDTLLSPSDLLGSDADEELVFDDEAPAAAAPVAEAKPAPKRARKSRAEVPVAAPGEALAAIETGPEQISAEAPLHASVEEPAAAPPAPFPPQAPASAGSKPQVWLLGIVALATVSSFASLGGLLMVSRTLAHAEADRVEAASERATFARIPDLVARLDAASLKLEAVTARATSASPAGPPATIADVRHELDMLKLALAQHQPEGLDALNSNVRGGFQDLATRLDRLAGRAPAPRAAEAAEDGAPAHAAPAHAPAPASHGRAAHPRNGTAFKD